jgi:hypothetical protein
VAEQSGLVGTTAIYSNYGGGWTGAGGSYWTVSSCGDNGNCYHNGLTVVRYAINLAMVAEGASKPYETNTILNSFHPGGIQGLLCDGSCRFLAATIDMENLRRLCSADDALPVNAY